eukprot:gene6796-8118_t
MALDDERVKKPQSENYNLFSMGVIVFLYSFWWQFSIRTGVDCSGGGGKATIVEVEELCREFEHANRPDALPDGALPYTVEVVSRVCQLQCDVGPNIDVYFRDRENHDELKWYYKKMDNAQDCRRLLKDVQAELKQPEEVLEDPGIMHRRAAAMRWDSLK